MEKQSITQTQARILIYLSSVHRSRKYVSAISSKLDIDYSYCLKVLQTMLGKGWLTKTAIRNKMFYFTTETAPIENAHRIYLNIDELQRELKAFEVAEDDN